MVGHRRYRYQMNEIDEINEKEKEEDNIETETETETETENGELHIHKRFVIVGIPERVIADNKISYKLPVRIYNDNETIGEQIRYLSVSEKDMMELLAKAKEMFANDETNKAYV